MYRGDRNFEFLRQLHRPQSTSASDNRVSEARTLTMASKSTASLHCTETFIRLSAAIPYPGAHGVMQSQSSTHLDPPAEHLHERFPPVILRIRLPLRLSLALLLDLVPQAGLSARTERVLRVAEPARDGEGCAERPYIVHAVAVCLGALAARHPVCVQGMAVKQPE